MLNIRGIQESARLNIFLALADLATQALLVIVGAVLILSPSGPRLATCTSAPAPTLSSFLISIPIGMVAYTGIETISNMAEEARDPGRDVPRSIGLVAARRVRDLRVPAGRRAVGDAGARDADVPTRTPARTTRRLLGRSSRATRSRASSRTSASGPLTTPVRYYVGLLAGTILIIATNAGLIGVSRLTYSMGVHRQFPEILRTVHPTYRTPWVAIVVYTFAAIALMVPAAASGPKGVAFLGNLYAFGAMLSFTIAHASVIALRAAQVPTPISRSARRSTCASARYDMPLFAILGGLGTFAAFIVDVDALPDRALHRPRLDGRSGWSIYVVYRKSPGAAADQDRARRPEVRGPGDRDRVHARSCCTSPMPRVADEMTVTALRLAGEQPRARRRACTRSRCRPRARCSQIAPRGRGARERASSARPRRSGAVRCARDQRGSCARATPAARSSTRPTRPRSARSSCSARPAARRARRACSATTVDYVLRHAPCKVMVGATPEWRGPQRPPSRARRVRRA